MEAEHARQLDRLRHLLLRRSVRVGATNIITDLAVSLQAAVLPVTVIAVGIWIIYPVGGGLFLPRRWGRT